MQEFKPKNTSNTYLFYYQLLDVSILILVDLSIFFMVDAKYFLVGQIFFIPSIIYLLSAKHKKQVLRIIIDEASKTIKFKINTLIFWEKEVCCSFNDLTMIRKRKWLFNSYLDVIQINSKNRKIALIPYKQSVWKKSELDLVALTLRNYIEYVEMTN